jgi:hypothetical protein
MAWGIVPMADRPEMTGWQPGQTAVIGRRHIVTVARVTKAGRAIVNHHGTERVFEPNGWERCSGSRRYHLDHLTPEIQSEIEQSARAVAVFRKLADVLDAAARWDRENRPRWGSDMAESAAVARAEQMAAAIEAIMKEPANAE